MEYNELTKRLLAEGYTAENYPKEVVRIPKSFNKENPLDNFSGGFEYVKDWISAQTFKTPCGLQCKGITCFSGMSYMGIKWDFENDMALVHCPKDCVNCELKHEHAGGANKYHCNVRMVDETYQYEGSVEQLKELQEADVQRKKKEFALQRNGRICESHMRYSRETGEWVMNYDPSECAKRKCVGYCPLLGKELDKKKGNVFYDTKISRRRYDLDGTLFEGQIDTQITKGNKVFESAVSMDICKNYVKMCSEELISDIKQNKYHSELFLAERYGRHFAVEIYNIRAESKASRDMQEDLKDMEDGSTISHASDEAKKMKEYKKEKRRKMKEANLQRLEKKLLTEGYENLEPHSLDRIHANKWLGEKRINELEELRQQLISEEKMKPSQLSLFDV